jgi:hypothetical protein
MRQGQQNNKRMRGRNRKGPNPLARTYESNGPDVKVRGTALHIAEKYVQLARDAQSSGDRVQAENYLQHAEHYYRIVSAAQAQMPQPQQIFRSDVDGDDEDERGIHGGQQPYPHSRNEHGSDSQPYVNGNGHDAGGHDDGDDSGNDAGDDQGMMAEAQPDAGGDSAPGEDGEPAPRESRARPRRRRPYRDRNAGAAPAEGAPQPETTAAAGDGE